MAKRSTASESNRDSSEPTIFVVDDDPQVRTSIEQLGNSVRLRVKTFAAADEFLTACDPSDAGCLVTDVRMPKMSGLELQQALQQTKITLPVIVMTGYAEIPMTIQAFQEGAFDFIQKPFEPQTLLDVIQRAIEKDSKNRIRDGKRVEIESKIEALSPRESEVLLRLVAGETTKQIAKALGISLTTVDFHRNNILAKMNVENVVELTHAVDFYEMSRRDP